MASVLSGIVLIVYAIVWIISFISNIAGTVTGSGFSSAIGVVMTVMQIFVYIVLLYNAWQMKGGFIYKLIIILVTLWLIFCAVSVYIPGL